MLHPQNIKLSLLTFISEVTSVMSLVVSFGVLLAAFSVFSLSFVIIYVANKWWWWWWWRIIFDFRVGCGASLVTQQEPPECVQGHGIAKLNFGILMDKTLRWQHSGTPYCILYSVSINAIASLLCENQSMSLIHVYQIFLVCVKKQEAIC